MLISFAPAGLTLLALSFVFAGTAPLPWKRCLDCAAFASRYPVLSRASSSLFLPAQGVIRYRQLSWESTLDPTTIPNHPQADLELFCRVIRS